MTNFACVRCGKDGDRLSAPPMPGDMGQRAYESICDPCWQEWLQHQTALINHYALSLRDPQAKQFLTQQAETFLFDAAQSQGG